MQHVQQLQCKAVALLIAVFLPFVMLSQGASYLEGGMMKLRLRDAGHYENNWVPGFSLAISGIEISLYAGKVPMKGYPDSLNMNANAGFYHLGYSWRSAPREKFKRAHLTMGIGIGGYGVRGMNGLQGSIKPGVQLNITRNISIAASLYAGYNYFFDKDTTVSWNSNSYLSTEKWFVHPAVTLRINTNPIAVMGDYYDKQSYWGGGMVVTEHTSREGDFIVTRRSSEYREAGNYITDAIITSNNYVNLYPKMLVGTMKNYKGNSIAFGGGVAVRAGLLALDIEYLQGQIGFHQSKIGSANDHWKVRRTSVGIGINWFNIPFPTKGPSLVRFILGARLGKLTLDSNRPELVPGEPNPEELFREKFWSPFFAFEFGTLGMHLEFFNQKQNGYASGLVLGATYLLPLRNPKR